MKIIYDDNGLYQVEGDGFHCYDDLHLYSSLFIQTSSVSGDTTITNQNIILADASDGAVTLTLPDASSLEGRKIIVKKIDVSANAVSLATTSSQMIDGDLSKEITDQYASISVVASGGNWFIV